MCSVVRPVIKISDWDNMSYHLKKEFHVLQLGPIGDVYTSTEIK